MQFFTILPIISGPYTLVKVLQILDHCLMYIYMDIISDQTLHTKGHAST